MKSWIYIAPAVFLAALPPAFGQLAATTTWTGTTDNDWNTGTNWSPGLPATADNAEIGTGDTVSTSAAAASDLNQLYLDGNSTLNLNHAMGITESAAGGGVWVGHIGASGPADLNINNGGSLTVATGVDNFRISRNNDSGTSTLTLNTGGSLSVGTTINIGRDNLANGVLTMDGGTLNHTSGDFLPGSFNGTGAFNMNGGTANINNMKVSFGGAANGSGTVTQTGGTMNHTGEIAVGWNSSRNGTYNMQGGVLNSSNRLRIGVSGSGTHTGDNLFNQTGGAVNITGDVNIGENGTGSFTYDISGGSLDSSSRLILGYFSAATDSTLKISGTGSVDANQLYLSFGAPGTTVDVDAGSLQIGNTYFFDQGTIDVSGGSVLLQNVYMNHNSHNQGSTINVSGGVLDVTGLLDADSGFDTVNFTGGTLRAGTMQVDNPGSSKFTVGAGTTLELSGGNQVFNDGLEVVSGGVTEIGGTLELGSVNTTMTVDGSSSIGVYGGNVVGTLGLQNDDLRLEDSAQFVYSVNPTVSYDTIDTIGLLQLGDINIELHTLGDHPSLPEYEYVMFDFTTLEDDVGNNLLAGGDDTANTALLNSLVTVTFTYAPLTQVGNLNNPQLEVVGTTIVLSGFSAVNVPEPSTLLLFGLGALLLRRRVQLRLRHF